MIFSRKMIVIVGAALLAACGDKVTVAGPTTTTLTPTPAVAKINSVDVAPATATISAGQSITFTAAVNADAGVTSAIAWSSSVSAVTVSSAGVVTTTAASATPGAAICATATAGTQSVKGCATLVVTAVPTIVPATVSIQSITAGGLNTPVNPAAVANQMDVTLNVNPGNQVITKVELLVGGAVAGTQTFTAAQSAALRFAADEAVAAQTTFPQIVFSVNTAAFNSATGAATWSNGTQTVSARLFTSAGGTATAATASAAQTLTFANVNTFTTAITVGGTTASVNNAAGYTYKKGDVIISVIPVSYNGAVLASMNVNFGAGVCNTGTAPALRTKGLTAPAAGAQAWTATFAGTGTAAASNISGYSFNPACGAIATGEGVQITTAQDATGANFTSTALPLNIGSQFRMDNLAPSAPALTMTVGRRNLSWVNDLVQFNDLTANTGIVSTASVDAGVGISTTATSVYATTVGTAVITTAASLAESIVNTTYSATTTGQDLLGNVSAASVAATFGVDRTAPTFVAAALPADATVIAAPGAVATGAFAYTDAATLPAGPSTPSATPVRMTVSKRTTATATAYTTGAAWGAAGAAATSYSIGLAGGFIDAIATNTQAYYVLSAFVEDGAGNASAPVTATYLYDITAPTGPFTIPVMTASAGASNLFSASLTDNFDIKSNQWAMEYAVLGAGVTLRLPATTFGAFLSFTKTATDAANYPLYRSMISGAFVAGAGQGLLNVSNSVIDRAGLSTAFAPTAVPAVNLPAAATADPLAAAITSGFTYAGFVVSNAVAGMTVDISGNAVETATLKNALDLTATATGTVNTMLNPFTRVEFWAYDATTLSYRYIGQSAAPTVVDNATNRVYTWTVNWNPDSYTASVATAGHPIIAIGVTSTFDAVRTAQNVTITTTP
ncbi:MAG: hypothetical protein NTW72_04930 [Gemmatimonadetes bacterium]|nr:hypothetical protein [Gemmatimonadota bacterium]